MNPAGRVRCNMGYRWSRGAGESSRIEILYWFHQNNDDLSVKWLTHFSRFAV